MSSALGIPFANRVNYVIFVGSSGGDRIARGAAVVPLTNSFLCSMLGINFRVLATSCTIFRECACYGLFAATNGRSDVVGLLAVCHLGVSKVTHSCLASGKPIGELLMEKSMQE
jgi:hypothetical protein